MKRPPDVTLAKDRVQADVEAVVARYIMRLVWVIVVASFSVGGFLMKMQMDISATRESVLRIEAKVKEHDELLQTGNKASETWRAQMAVWQADFEKRLAGEMALRTSNRLTAADYDTAVWMQRQSADRLLPYFAELRQFGRAHN